MGLINMMRHRFLIPKVLSLSMFWALSICYAQFSYFGKNKVQTRDYEFQSFETENFKILFYPGGEGLAEFAARAAEDFYAKTSQDLNMELEAKVPIIIYLSPGQFAETNVITDLLDEGVGGFSELIRNRIVVPFNGSYRDFYHVIGHELTHIFEFQMFYRSRLAALLGAIQEFQVPLWIMEGFAEFQSGWVTVNSEIFMRDLVLITRQQGFEHNPFCRIARNRQRFTRRVQTIRPHRIPDFYPTGTKKQWQSWVGKNLVQLYLEFAAGQKP